MTKILAIDASTESCSAALLINEQVYERSEVIPRKHTELILPMVDEVLAEGGLSLNQLDALAFNRGPGSFTGVRVSTSVTQGLAFAIDLPVIPVSGLAAVAQGAWRNTRQENFLVVLDARMKEVYWACYQYQPGSMKLLGEEHVSPVTAISKPGAGEWLAVGNGVSVYNKEMSVLAGTAGVVLSTDTALPQARDVVELAKSEYEVGNTVSAMDAQPTYLRDKVV
ncbi:MAG: tRNA (adenosine(37)-N6)-threonylcarbamoyltransferase complex dimerization subunit type 1 TsaB [Gammaproteobacteria bacterium]|jgi:tRNA threonylcarbamoyladenosine biosynthesis protein TsaB